MALEVLDQGMVVGRYLVRVVDGSDLDRKPDTRSISGTVTFTPSTDRVAIATAGPAATVWLRPIVATIDSDGYLGVRQRNVIERGVMLDIGSAATVPALVNWRVTFDLYAGADKVKIPAFTIAPVKYTGVGTEWDLTLKAPAPTGNPMGPVIVSEAVAAAARAEAAALRAELAASGAGGGQSLVPDPGDPDTYIVAAGGGLAPDTSDPDTFILS